MKTPEVSVPVNGAPNNLSADHAGNSCSAVTFASIGLALGR